MLISLLSYKHHSMFRGLLNLHYTCNVYEGATYVTEYNSNKINLIIYILKFNY